MKRTRVLSPIALLLALAAFVLINLAAQPLLRYARLDLTENKLNTLSQGSLAILGKVPQPITLDFYLSRQALEQFPGLKSYTTRVQELLQEMALRSQGKLTVNVIDPIPFSEEEDRAVESGLQNVPVGTDASGSFYFGLVGKTGDRKEIISFFQPEREQLLEYDLSHLIYKLSHTQQIRLGLVNTLRMQGGMDNSNPSAGLYRPWAIIGMLRRHFELQILPSDLNAIPENIDVLMLVQPKLLDTPMLYAIDQFVMRGGRVIAFVDPLSEVSAARNQGEVFVPDTSTPLLLKSWGVKLADSKVVADLGAAQQVSMSRTVRSEVMKYVPWLELGRELMAQDDAVTGQLSSVRMGSAGALEVLPDSGTTVSPLIRSTTQAMLIEAGELAYAPDPRRLLANFKPTGESYVLAARVTGSAKTAFPGGPPKGDDGEPLFPPDEQRMQSDGSVHLLIVADSDILFDRFWVEVSGFFGQQVVKPVSNNSDLAINAVEQLGGSADLIGIRSRGTYNRPFTLVNKLQDEAELKFRATEQQLLTRLRETEEKMAKLQQMRQDARSSEPSAEQLEEIRAFRADEVKTRKELRDVQFELRRDIERVATLLKVVNIGLVPVLVSLAALGLWLVRRRRERRYLS